MKFIGIQNLSFRYEHRRPVFEEFSLTLGCNSENGYIYGLMGSSGSGKSTLLKLILGIEKQFQGAIRIKPDTTVMSYVPQEPVLFEHLSIRENAEYLSTLARYRDRFDRKQFDQFGAALGLTDLLNSSRSVLELSGGQRQRLALLRALSVRPDVLLLDEPCNGLDAEVKRQFLFMLRKLVIRHRTMALYVTHHSSEVQLISDEIVYLLSSGAGKGIGQKAQAETFKFIDTPPAIEAAEVFHFPEFNSLPYEIVDSRLKVLASGGNGRMVFPPESIGLSKEFGFEYDVVSQTEAYSEINIRAVQEIVVIKRPRSDVMQNRRIFFTGRILVYDRSGRLVGPLEIVRNDVKK